MIKSFQVIDDFCERIEEVRASAFGAGFTTWNPGKGTPAEAHIDGMGFGGLHSILTHSLIKATGAVVLPNLTHFRMTGPQTDRATIHSDAHAGTQTCIVYLTKNENKGATAFWKHKQTGLTSMPANPDKLLASLLRDDMAKSRMEDWEVVDLVSGEYNRALIFNAPLFHCRYPMQDAVEMETMGRLVWVMHFNRMEVMK